ncbi:MAG: hypothetical protein ACFFDN_42715 [Candidatus Hodarchaeota archaeon]
MTIKIVYTVGTGIPLGSDVNCTNSKFGVRFSGLNYSVDDHVHNYPLFAVAKETDLNRKYVDSLME